MPDPEVTFAKLAPGCREEVSTAVLRGAYDQKAFNVVEPLRRLSLLEPLRDGAQAVVAGAAGEPGEGHDEAHRVDAAQRGDDALPHQFGVGH